MSTCCDSNGGGGCCGGGGCEGGDSYGGGDRWGVTGMLVFSRKVGEKISIGDEIEISVVRVSPSTVRIGVVAPKECTIVRGELLARRDAAGTATSGKSSMESGAAGMGHSTDSSVTPLA